MSSGSSSKPALRSGAEAEAWLMGLINYERTPPTDRRAARVFHLDRFKRLLERLGEPQNDFSSVHIAGTSGKGWTASALAAVCQAAGLKTGLYISPHLESFRERIQIDGEWISPRAFVQGISELGPRFGAEKGEGFRTVFEILTALAFVTFSRAKADIAIIETGLGGRLDCTNALEQPALCVITALGLDHTAILGNSVAQIARDKAGIIKPGAAVIVAPQPRETRAEALGEIRRATAARATRAIEADRRVKVALERENLSGSTWRATLDGRESLIRWRMFGPAAGENLQTILACVGELRRQGFELPDAAVRRGLAEWEWPGRLEVVSRRPTILLDGAHNTISARALRAALDRAAPGRPIQWVVGMMSDKRAAELVTEIAAGREKDGIVCFTAASQRRLPAPELAKIALDIHPRVACRKSLCDAMSLALREAGKRGIVVVTGSLYNIAPARREALRAVWERYEKNLS